MKNTILILTLLLLTIPQSKLFACAQIPDKLIYNNDTLSIVDYPLEFLYSNNEKRPDFFNGKVVCVSTGCWRNYQAEWIIVDEQLYLTNIKSCCLDIEIESDLNSIFGDKCVNGRVKADWFTGNVTAIVGEPIIYLRFDDFIFPYEREFEFNQGNLKGTKNFDNTKSRQSVYFKDNKLRESFIYKNIRWTALPELKGKTIKVKVQFYANENGVVDSVVVAKRNNSKFDNEAIRIIKSLPDWNIYLRKGKALRTRYYQTIVFNEKMKSGHKHIHQ